jgi:hypothetical protein
LQCNKVTKDYTVLLTKINIDWKLQ